MSAARSNRQIENAALKYVIEQEALEGRKAVDTRGNGAAGDLLSGDRVVEMKAFGGSARGADLWLEERQVDEARANPGVFWLYLVENIRQGDPAKVRVLRFGGSQLQDLLDRARPQRYYTVPFPVAVYDSAVLDQGGEASTT
jgi:hypothetical protein